MNVSFVTATYRDLRVIETIQSLRLHGGLPSDADIVVVDNSPDSPESKLIADFCTKAGVRYVPFSHAVGTSPSRNYAIAQASGEWVACFDSHVLFPVGFYDAIQEAIAYAGDERVLFHAVKLYDDLRTHYASHFEPVFRHGMLGIWAYDERAKGTEPFEIPGSGFGFFLVRKLDFFAAGAFHPLARGFGGEEICFHEMFRRAGGRVMCAPKLQYWHNFHRLEVPYPLLLRDKVRNYVLWFKRLGWDINRIKKHFVQGYLEPERDSQGQICEVSPHTMTEQEFQAILAECERVDDWNAEITTTTSFPFPYSPYTPTTATESQKHAPKRRCGSCGKEVPREEIGLIRERLNALGIDEKRVLIMTIDQRWVSAFPNAYYASPYERYPRERLMLIGMHQVPKPPEGCDVLIWDSPQPIGHLFESISDRLYVWPTIVIARTGLTEKVSVHAYNPQTREHRLDEQPSILSVLTKWLLGTGSMYTVLYFGAEGQGFAILSRDRELVKHEHPNWLEKARGFLSALSDHISTGAAKTPEQIYQQRLRICALCEKRDGAVCSACGCPIFRKARWLSSSCPLGKW